MWGTKPSPGVRLSSIIARDAYFSLKSHSRISFICPIFKYCLPALLMNDGHTQDEYSVSRGLIKCCKTFYRKRIETVYVWSTRWYPHYCVDLTENRAKRRIITWLSLAEIDISNRHRDSTDRLSHVMRDGVIIALAVVTVSKIIFSIARKRK